MTATELSKEFIQLWQMAEWDSLEELLSEDIELIILEIKSKLKISSIGIYYPIKSEISPLKLIKICKNLS